MMKQFLPLLLVLSLSSCELFMSPYDVIRDPDISFSSLEEIQTYVWHNITYASDHVVHGGEYWQAPQETISRGTGDCEDFAIFVGYFAERDLGMDVELLGVEEYEGGNHMLVVLDDIIYEAQSLSVRKAPIKRIIWRMDMKEGLQGCVNDGSRTIKSCPITFDESISEEQ